MKRILIVGLFLAAMPPAFAGPAGFQLPAFPMPPLVSEGGSPKEFSSVRLMREFHRSGVRTSENFETMDTDYALIKVGSMGHLAAWLETACKAVDLDLLQARERNYDGTTFGRLLSVATSLAALRQRDITLAMPIGVLTCLRGEAWGDLPADGAEDAYIVFVTDEGIFVYDPPTRQLAPLAEFPNKTRIKHIRF